MNFQQWFEKSIPGLSFKSAQAVISLSAEGATLPFIARYRKEKTGGMDEVGIQTVLDAKDNFENIIKRQKSISDEIEKQGKLDADLKKKISSCFVLSELEDIYLPYKQKKKTKATIAKESGLQALADWMWSKAHNEACDDSGLSLDDKSKQFIDAEKKIADSAAAIKGAEDILTEKISENVELRSWVRETILSKGHLFSIKAKTAKANSKFEPYFEFNESVQSLLKGENSHRYLAIRRGWLEQELSIHFEADGTDTLSLEDELQNKYNSFSVSSPLSDEVLEKSLLKCARMALKVYVLPSIENDVHKDLREVADIAAIMVFAENVKELLLAAPLGPKTVLGVDPGIRTGCKLAVVDASGKFLSDAVMHLNTDSNKQAAEKGLKAVIAAYNIEAIAVGNGTAGRETEGFVRKVIKDNAIKNVNVVMVNESGASIYSASSTAREEFPDLDITVRGAISIARRLQDPLAELVKIDAKSIGVGQYQHDVSQVSLKKRLDLVVDVCVNSVGVDLNTASYHLLSRVAGIGPGLAKAIVEYRSSKGLFESKQDLIKVSRFTEKTLEQAAGFLRLPNAKHPLDNTGVHPERYKVLEEVAQKMGATLKELMGKEGVRKLKNNEYSKQLKQTLGEYTYDDIIKELEKPGRDPRQAFAAFAFRDDIYEVKDLKQDMICPGIVTNVTNFGAFVDIGVHQDGLVHLSQLANVFVKDPKDHVSPGQHVTVKVLEVNLDKKQIALTMKLDEKSNPSFDNKKKYVAGKKPQSTKPIKKFDRQNNKSNNHSKPRNNSVASATHNPFASLASFKVKKK